MLGASEWWTRVLTQRQSVEAGNITPHYLPSSPLNFLPSPPGKGGGSEDTVLPSLGLESVTEII